MKKISVFFVILILLFNCGCYSKNQKQNNIPEIKIVLFPSGWKMGKTYLIELENNGLIKTSYGNMNSVNIYNDNFLTEKTVKTKQLTKQQIEDIVSMINKFDNSKYIQEDECYKDIGEVVLYIYDEKYSFYYDYTKNTVCKELVDLLIDYSPLKINKDYFT